MLNLLKLGLKLEWSTPSEADSFRNMKVKISYTPEKGHVGRNM
jgi:hypothetical protein